MLPTENPLPPELRPVLYRIDCDCAPLFENEFGTCQAYEKPWIYVWNKVITLHHPSLATNTIGSSQCFNNPAFATQTPSASVFKVFQKKIADIFASSNLFDVRILSGSEFWTSQEQTTSTDFKQPIAW